MQGSALLWISSKSGAFQLLILSSQPGQWPQCIAFHQRPELAKWSLSGQIKIKIRIRIIETEKSFSKFKDVLLIDWLVILVMRLYRCDYSIQRDEKPIWKAIQNTLSRFWQLVKSTSNCNFHNINKSMIYCLSTFLNLRRIFVLPHNIEVVKCESCNFGNSI